MTELLVDAAVVGGRRRRCPASAPAARHETRDTATPRTRRPSLRSSRSCVPRATGAIGGDCVD
jgi:hypothetical protein